MDGSRRYKRRRSLRQHGSVCPYCFVRMERSTFYLDNPRRPTRDHIIARSRGGPDCLENTEVVCMRCNQLKASLLPDEFRAWLEGRASRIDKGVKWRTYWGIGPGVPG